MMLSLFSSFDPYLGLFNLNWLCSLMSIFFVTQIFWFNKNRLSKMINNLMLMMVLEFKVILVNKFNLVNLLMFNSLFLFLFMNNFMGLFPYIFVSTGHLVLSLMFSLSMWLGLMLFGWLKNYNHMFVHLVPMSTPFVLMFFMVLIESLSNIIRPITLAIRLVANMVAGHLLLTLISSFVPNIMVFLLILPVEMILLLLEISVSFIQGYVYVILMVLYLKETN